ncbi:MAG: hypothetical protein JXR86_00200 [Spirochaetales bacterium]|nr:hypothetical protein [Spirochaetales bacterium]
MAVEVKKIELTGHVDRNGHLKLEADVPFKQGDVKVLPATGSEVVEDEDISTMDILRTAQAGGAFDFLNDPEEDIYTLEDGVPFND